MRKGCLVLVSLSQFYDIRISNLRKIISLSCPQPDYLRSQHIFGIVLDHSRMLTVCIWSILFLVCTR